MTEIKFPATARQLLLRCPTTVHPCANPASLYYSASMRISSIALPSSFLGLMASSLRLANRPLRMWFAHQLPGWSAPVRILLSVRVSERYWLLRVSGAMKFYCR